MAHDQVHKQRATGDRLPAGQFVIRGSKEYLPPTQLLMGLGVLFKAVARETTAEEPSRNLLGAF